VRLGNPVGAVGNPVGAVGAVGRAGGGGGGGGVGGIPVGTPIGAVVNGGVVNGVGVSALPLGSFPNNFINTLLSSDSPNVSSDFCNLVLYFVHNI